MARGDSRWLFRHVRWTSRRGTPNLAVLIGTVLVALGASGPADEPSLDSNQLTKPSETASRFSATEVSVTEMATPSFSVADSAILPIDHRRHADGQVVAQDLEHGSGWARLSVERIWSGKASISEHFGPGWSDLNSIRLFLISPDQVLVTRGGIGWRTAFRSEAQFVTGEGESLVRNEEQGWTLALADQTQLFFSSAGQLLRVSSPFGVERHYEYHEHGGLKKISEAQADSLQYHYNRRHQVTQIEGPEGLRAEYRYDSQGRLASVITARGVELRYQYSEDSVRVTDTFGQAIEIDSPRAGSLPATASDESIGSFDRVKAPLELMRDQRGRVTRVELPEGTFEITYDSFDRPIQVRHPDGRFDRAEYSVWGLPTRIIQADGRVETREYDAFHRLTLREDSLGLREALQYDGQNRVSLIRSGASEVQLLYDASGNVIEMRDSSGIVITRRYDAANRLVEQRTNQRHHRTWNYDEAGRLVQETDGDAKVDYRYDPTGQLVEIIDSVRGSIQLSDFSADGLTWTQAIPGLSPRQIRMNEWGPAQISDSADRTTLIQYSDLGQTIGIITPSGSQWSYEYDDAQRLSAIRLPSQAATLLRRDVGGRVTEILRPGGLRQGYRYDALGRLIEETSVSGVAVGYTYDESGRLQELSLPDGVVAIEEDLDSGVTALKAPEWSIIDQRDRQGKLRSRSYAPSGMQLRWPLDADGRAAGIEFGSLNVVYRYDVAGNISRIELPGGTGISIDRDGARRVIGIRWGESLVGSYRYDAVDRPIETKVSNPDSVLLSEQWTWDAGGNPIEMIRGDQEKIQYSFDLDDRLLRMTRNQQVQTWSYDRDGNLESIGNDQRIAIWKCDAAGRPESLGPLRYRWDSDGNLASVESGEATESNRFDAAGRLVERRVRGDTIRYGYLPNRDRLWLETDLGRTWYAYDESGLVGRKDPEGVDWLLVRMPGSNQPLALCNSRGECYFVVADPRGSIRCITDIAGAIVEEAEYRPYGQILKAKGLELWSEFAGMVVDRDGLCYARARYYDPRIARFITPDREIGSPGIPLSQNAYAYAACNPLRYRDPWGASPQPLGTRDPANRLGVGDSAVAVLWTAGLLPVHEPFGSGDRREEGLNRVAAAEWRQRSQRGTVQPMTGASWMVSAASMMPRPVGSGISQTFVHPLVPSIQDLSVSVMESPGAAAAESLASKLGRVVNLIKSSPKTPWTGAIAVTVVTAAVVKTIYDQHQAATAEEQQAQQAFQGMMANLKTTLEQALSNPDQAAKLPAHPDGVAWNPQDPTHLTKLMEIVSKNLQEGRPIFAPLDEFAADDQWREKQKRQFRDLLRELQRAQQMAKEKWQVAHRMIEKDAMRFELEQLGRAARSRSDRLTRQAVVIDFLRPMMKAVTDLRAQAEQLADEICGQPSDLRNLEQAKFEFQNKRDKLQSNLKTYEDRLATLIPLVNILEGDHSLLVSLINLLQGYPGEDVIQRAIGDATAADEESGKVERRVDEFQASYHQGLDALAKKYQSRLDALFVSRRPESEGTALRFRLSAVLEERAASRIPPVLVQNSMAIREEIVSVSELQQAVEEIELSLGDFNKEAVIQQLAAARMALERAGVCWTKLGQQESPSTTQPQSEEPPTDEASDDASSSIESPDDLIDSQLDDTRTMPAVLNERLRTARAVLSGLKLNVRYQLIGRKGANRSDEDLEVVAQDPSAGMRVRAGDTVWLSVVDTGPTPADTPALVVDVEPGKVPTLQGLTLDQAQVQLAAAGLTLIGVEVLGPPPEDKADQADRICRQSPAAGVPSPADGLVRVVVYGRKSSSVDIGAAPPVMPDPTIAVPNVPSPPQPIAPGAPHGFLVGDGRFLHARLAEASVGSGVFPEAEGTEIDLPSSGENTSLVFRRTHEEPLGDSEVLIIKRMSSKEDAEKFLEFARRQYSVRAEDEVGERYERHTPVQETSATRIRFEWWFVARDEQKQPYFGYRGAVEQIIYRDVFIIGYQQTMSRAGRVQEDPGVDHGEIISNAKKLIDARFPAEGTP